MSRVSLPSQPQGLLRSQTVSQQTLSEHPLEQDTVSADTGGNETQSPTSGHAADRGESYKSSGRREPRSLEEGLGRGKEIREEVAFEQRRW